MSFKEEFISGKAIIVQTSDLSIVKCSGCSRRLYDLKYVYVQLKGLNSEDMLVYQAIEHAGTTGILRRGLGESFVDSSVSRNTLNG